jgi:type 1 fimbriae regulatory protein FimB/type 1 fimbriae regulatory protein FimE
MLRHACGFKLANDGHDIRALQTYLGHKNIQHTVRYTEPAPMRFEDFWRRAAAWRSTAVRAIAGWAPRCDYALHRYCLCRVLIGQPFLLRLISGLLSLKTEAEPALSAGAHGCMRWQISWGRPTREMPQASLS